MSIYNPPLHINSVFNTTDYDSTNSSSVSQSDADSKYLKKVGNPVSTASLTTFNGSMIVKGAVELGTQGGGGTFTNINRGLSIKQIDGATNGQGRISYTGGVTTSLNFVAENSADNLIPTNHKFSTCGAGSATQNLQMTIENDKTTFNNGVQIGTFGVSSSLRLITALNMNDVGTNTGYFSQIYYSGQNTKYYSGQGASSTFHTFYTKNSNPTPADVESFYISSTENISKVPLVLTDGALTPSSQISQSGNDMTIKNNTSSGAVKVNINSTDVLSVSSSAVSVSGTLNLTSGVNTSEIVQSGTTLTIANKVPSSTMVFTTQTSGGANQGMTLTSTLLALNNFVVLNARNIRSTSAGSSHNFFDDLIINGTLTIGGTASTNGIRGNTTFTQDVNLSSRLQIRSTQYVGGVQTISTINPSALIFPLEEIIVLSNATASTIVITLPTITASNLGFTFKFIKTGSITNSVQFSTGGTNVIYSSSSITNVASYTTMATTQTNKTFMTLETTTAGVYVWKEIL